MSATRTEGATAAPPGAAPPARRLLGVVLLIPLVVALALWAFAWPAARTAPREVPLGVAGSAGAVASLEKRLGSQEGAFEIHRYADEAAARAAIEDREVYGAMVATPEGGKLLTATAGGPVVAQLLTEAARAQAPDGEPVVEDVVAASAEDPRQSGLNAIVLPLAMAGVASGAVVTLLGIRGVRAVAVLLGASALVGLVATGLTDNWLGILRGDWWAEAGVLGLATLAVGGAVAGIASLLGRAGIGVGALLVIFLGNPFSGVATSPELLPEPVGRIGQLLPPGAEGSLLRSVSFFDGAAASGPLLTLGVWALLGLSAVLVGAGLRRGGSGSAPPGPSPTGEPHPAA
ncbi:ABC transporter permease [Streptomyces physcomitrii]|uniref:ABC transporter permease n=1 Tax=Streptomyces physcomitrii TaxID=2724184 RepID=A0ABX1H0M1_9ACTN|nr:ABC transporter permease [Streptomyces physcomitrii]NKI41893.1 ABC transporter permease [Streptomyces physcomitrii]